MPQIGRVAAAALSGAIVSAAAAQDAVQWRVEDGGNGHWYRFVDCPEVPGGVVFAQLDAEAAAVGGYLVSITSVAEWDFVRSPELSAYAFWTGLRSNQCDTWQWTTGEAVAFTAWGSSNCGAGPYPNNCSSTNLAMRVGNRIDCGWNWDDFPQGLVRKAEHVIEWSADCNDDGIVDYGQILDGTYPDEDDNGVPDCCEGGTCSGDLNLDDRVDAADIGLLIAAWNTDGSIVAGSDINGNGLVDAADLGLLIGAWGPCGGCN